ncbi:hypothetical protein NPIL_423881 [Nephila pilipes]|uniref:Uncharacterized protein n=1 Tax=Nephila pilipes TaxID=299642 RepID=A0A8X6P808_NEPPI|nr:hypothetical protein NPIL_423881 [Nephila pilipes]
MRSSVYACEKKETANAVALYSHQVIHLFGGWGEGKNHIPSIFFPYIKPFLSWSKNIEVPIDNKEAEMEALETAERSRPTVTVSSITNEPLAFLLIDIRTLFITIEDSGAEV